MVGKEGPVDVEREALKRKTTAKPKEMERPEV